MKEKVQFDDILAFVRKHGFGICLKGALSLGLVVGVIALYYAFAPRVECYKGELQVTLESRDGVQVYPNGDRFGFRDIISAPVMNRIWKKYGFDAKGVKFEDFTQWFSIVAYDKERAKIDAEFQSKMSKRNITVAELTALQKDYETRLAALASSRFALTIQPKSLLDRDTVAKILADIPEFWFVEYAMIKAPQIPAVVSVDAIRSYVERSKESGGRALELIDAIRRYLAELKATCEFVRNGIMRGRNAKVDGVDLGAYESQLALFSAEILRLKNRLLVNGSEEDLGGYLAARMDDLDCEKLELEERVKAVQQTFDLIGEFKRGSAEQTRGGGAASDGAAAQLTLQADNGFFADFAAMVRRDANQELVRRYAHELTELRKQQADFASRRLYYDQIERYMRANVAKTSSGKSAAEAVATINVFTQQLFDVGAKIVAFRDECLALYRTSDQFYVIAAPTVYAKSFAFSLARFALGLLAIWFLYNLVALVKLWNRE